MHAQQMPGWAQVEDCIRSMLCANRILISKLSPERPGTVLGPCIFQACQLIWKDLSTSSACMATRELVPVLTEERVSCAKAWLRLGTSLSQSTTTVHKAGGRYLSSNAQAIPPFLLSSFPTLPTILLICAQMTMAWEECSRECPAFAELVAWQPRGEQATCVGRFYFMPLDWTSTGSPVKLKTINRHR